MKIRLLLTAVLLLLGLSLLAEVKQGAAAAGEDNGYENIAVLTRAMQLIRQDYVDEKKTNYRALTYAAIKGMFNSLDPHSRFMDPGELKGMEDDTRSEFGGIGVTVTTRDGVLTVVSPMEDTPGFRAGLLPGDQILKINGEATEQMELSHAMERLRGAAGQKVTLTILRAGTHKIKEFTIERAIIKVASVKEAKVLDAKLTGETKIGYVRITQFNEPTAAELGAKLDALEAQGIQALILDLRNNPGGILEGAVDVCGQFVGPNTMVVSTEGRVASARKVYKTSADAKRRPRYPLAILINGGSASAAEIVAGALRDLKRAILVGETSFGKGSVQSVIELQDGAGVRLTTARYYTPGKQVIHEKGIAPNIRATMTPQQESLLVLQRREGGLDEADQKLLAGFRDTQLERAADALKGVLLYASTAK
ncbi:MAG: S41 family peptidase [Verrucomicrobia bacterium]|nr:S41 family peptidase [Verrucomicrobiota bacterium]